MVLEDHVHYFTKALQPVEDSKQNADEDIYLHSDRNIPLIATLIVAAVRLSVSRYRLT